MTGGSEADTFVFTANNQSTTVSTTRDIITDFVVGTDIIDLSGIDAISNVGGNQAFSFVGTAAFTALGQVRYSYQVVSGVEYTVIETNSTGNLSADFSVALTGHLTPVAGAFVL